MALAFAVRTVVVLNPVAGSAGDVGATAAMLAAIPGVRVVLTMKSGDAEMLAREAVEQGARRIVAAGGDGTVNQVLNGIATALDRVELGILPLGTGNDFTGSIGMRLPMEEAIAALRRWESRAVDLVRVRAVEDGRSVERLMLNGSAGGFVQAVGAATDQGSKRGMLGSLSYILTAAVSLPELTEYEISVRTDGQQRAFRGLACLVSNGRTLGGGVMVNPEGLVDDGRVEVMGVKAVGLGELALVGVAMVGGTHQENPNLVFSQGRRVEIQSDPAMLVNVDGETLGETPVEYEVLPGALRVVVGPEAPALRRA